MRELFAPTKDARAAGLTGQASFNVPGAAAEAGEGQVRVEIHPGRRVRALRCVRGTSTRKVLKAVKLKGRMYTRCSVPPLREALGFLGAAPKVLRRLHVLDEIGLGYLRLGRRRRRWGRASASDAARLAATGSERLLHPRRTDDRVTFDDIARLLAASRRLLQRDWSPSAQPGRHLETRYVDLGRKAAGAGGSWPPGTPGDRRHPGTRPLLRADSGPPGRGENSEVSWHEIVADRFTPVDFVLATVAARRRWRPPCRQRPGRRSNGDRRLRGRRDRHIKHRAAATAGWASPRYALFGNPDPTVRAGVETILTLYLVDVNCPGGGQRPWRRRTPPSAFRSEKAARPSTQPALPEVQRLLATRRCKVEFSPACWRCWAARFVLRELLPDRTRVILGRVRCWRRNQVMEAAADGLGQLWAHAAGGDLGTGARLGSAGRPATLIVGVRRSGRPQAGLDERAPGGNMMQRPWVSLTDCFNYYKKGARWRRSTRWRNRPSRAASPCSWPSWAAQGGARVHRMAVEGMGHTGRGSTVAMAGEFQVKARPTVTTWPRAVAFAKALDTAGRKYARLRQGFRYSSLATLTFNYLAELNVAARNWGRSATNGRESEGPRQWLNCSALSASTDIPRPLRRGAGAQRTESGRRRRCASRRRLVLAGRNRARAVSPARAAGACCRGRSTSGRRSTWRANLLGKVLVHRTPRQWTDRNRRNGGRWRTDRPVTPLPADAATCPLRDTGRAYIYACRHALPLQRRDRAQLCGRRSGAHPRTGLKAWRLVVAARPPARRARKLCGAPATPSCSWVSRRGEPPRPDTRVAQLSGRQALDGSRGW